MKSPFTDPSYKVLQEEKTFCIEKMYFNLSWKAGKEPTISDICFEQCLASDISECLPYFMRDRILREVIKNTKQYRSFQKRINNILKKYSNEEDWILVRD